MKKIELAKDTIDKADIDKLIEWLKTYPRLTKGELTIEFEHRWSKIMGSKYSVYCNSGSSANLLMLYSLITTKRLRSKKIAVPALSWITDIAPVIQFGLEPVLIDCNLDDLSVDISELRKTFETQDISCLLLVSVLGLVPNMPEIVALCKEYDVILLEDFCESLGSEFDNKKIGTWGLMGSCSMYFGHHISTIEGGMVNTDDEEIYETLKMLRSHGWDRDVSHDYRSRLRSKYSVKDFNALYTFYHPGFNLRATDLQAFIGIGQLDKLSHIIHKRNLNYRLFDTMIKNPYWKPEPHEKKFVSNLGYPVIHKYRDEIIFDLVTAGIEARPLISGSMCGQPFYRELYGLEVKRNAKQVDELGFYIPNHPFLEYEDIQSMCDIINKYE